MQQEKLRWGFRIRPKAASWMTMMSSTRLSRMMMLYNSSFIHRIFYPEHQSLFVASLEEISNKHPYYIAYLLHYSCLYFLCLITYNT
jgi:hypothetical protein